LLFLIEKGDLVSFHFSRTTEIIRKIVEKHMRENCLLKSMNIYELCFFMNNISNAVVKVHQGKLLLLKRKYKTSTTHYHSVFGHLMSPCSK